MQFTSGKMTATISSLAKETSSNGSITYKYYGFACINSDNQKAYEKLLEEKNSIIESYQLNKDKISEDSYKESLNDVQSRIDAICYSFKEGYILPEYLTGFSGTETEQLTQFFEALCDVYLAKEKKDTSAEKTALESMGLCSGSKVEAIIL